MAVERYRAHALTKKIFAELYPSFYGITREISTKTIIYTADGSNYAGGMADRFRGMVSLYKIAQSRGLSFKINMSSPFELTNFLQPNSYDWTIEKGDISYDPSQAITYTHWCSGSDVESQEQRAVGVVRSFLKRFDQLHYTTNIYIADNEYGHLFDELFKPTNELQTQIDFHLEKIGSEYISVTFRFQQLLGDFLEGDYPTLSAKNQEKLIQRCIAHLREIFSENTYSKILVTSDSEKFLAEAKMLEFVYVIPGSILHLEYSLQSEMSLFNKSFLDYYLLTKSKKVYLVIDGQMYDSGFPYRAALHHGASFVKREYSC